MQWSGLGRVNALSCNILLWELIHQLLYYQFVPPTGSIVEWSEPLNIHCSGFGSIPQQMYDTAVGKMVESIKRRGEDGREERERVEG